MDEIYDLLEKNSIYYEKIAMTETKKLSLDNEFSIELTELNSGWFNKYFNENK